MSDAEKVELQNLKGEYELDENGNVRSKMSKHWANNIDPDIRLDKQLQGKGQIKDFMSSPNIYGYAPSDLIQKTPRQINELIKDDPDKKDIISQIGKLFQGRDLGKRNKNK